MTTVDLFSACKSPLDLMKLRGIEPPSPAVATIIRAIYGQAMTAADAALWPTISKTPWPTSKGRRAVLKVGRRGHKTTILAWCAVFELLCGGHERHVPAGSRIYAAICAPFQSQSREAVRQVKAILQQLAPLVSFEVRGLPSVPEINIHKPGAHAELVVTLLTADASAVRGFAVVFEGEDENGFQPSDSHAAQTGKDISRAIGAGMVQFPNALSVHASTPGPPAGIFYDLCEKPRARTLVISCPSFVTNPRLDEASLREELGDDPQAFEQEIMASRWGYGGETWLDATAVRECADISLDDPPAQPMPGGQYVIAYDLGQVIDDAVIGVFSSDLRGDECARHVVMRYLWIRPASRTNPLSIKELVRRLLALSREWNGAAIVGDPHKHLEVTEGLAEAGRKVEVAKMDPVSQTARWQTTRSLVHGRRFHYFDHPLIVSQMSQLRAQQLSRSGALKIEGRKDDIADVLALAAERALTLEPTGGDYAWDETPMFVVRNPFRIVGGERRWYRQLPNGGRLPVPPPPGSIERTMALEAISAAEGGTAEELPPPKKFTHEDRRLKATCLRCGSVQPTASTSTTLMSCDHCR